jgi:hypothetical protein
MARYAWGIKNITTNVTWTSSVLSFNFTNGRKSYLDNYSAGALTLTIKNQANESAGFNFGDQIDVLSPTSMGVGNAIFSFYVVQVSYNDYPGNTGLSTAEIICQDALGLMGRLQMNNFSILAKSTGQQFSSVTGVPGFILYQPTLETTGDNGSSCSAGTYSGSVLNFWNLLVNTERTVLAVISVSGDKSTARFFYRNGITKYSTQAINFSNVASPSLIGYESFERINLGLDLMNQVQIQPAGLTTQQATNATSVSSYGAQGFTVSTVDSTTTQALGLAEWLSNTLSDVTKQRFVVTFTDSAQSLSDADFSLFLYNISQKIPTNLTYRVPGSGSDTTEKVICEGISVSANPSETTITAYLTPLTYYQFFTLDSTTLGILDTSRFGW